MSFVKRIAILAGAIALATNTLTVLGALYASGHLRSEIRIGASDELVLSKKISTVMEHQLEQALEFQRSLWFPDGLNEKDRGKFIRNASHSFDDAAKQISQELGEIKRVAAGIKTSGSETTRKLWAVIATRIAEIEKEQVGYEQLARDGFQLLQSGQTMEAQRAGINAEQGHQRLREQLQQLTTELAKVGRNSAENVESRETYFAFLMGALVLLGGMIGLVAGTLYAGRVTGAMEEAVAGLTHVAESMSEAVGQVVNSSRQAAAAVQTSAGAAEHVRRAAQAATTHAKEINLDVQNNAQASKTGEHTVDHALEVLRNVRQEIESMAVSVLKLRERSRSVSELMATLNEVSEQSKVLALNTAIEAAKAGEAGGRFAAVAAEAKAFAEQSRAATVTARKVLTEVQKAANVAVMVTEQGSRNVEAGIDRSIEASESVRSLVRAIAEPSPLAGQILAASERQAEEASQVATAIENLRSTSSRGFEGAQRLEEGAAVLSAQSERLRALIGNGNGAA